MAETNLLVNGGFDRDADADGLPDSWSTSGDSHVRQRMALDEGRGGGRAARLECTQFAAFGPASHAMLCQMNVSATRGKQYRLTFWARGKEIACDVVSVALSDTSVWAPCGLEGAFAPTPQWRRYEFVARAIRDCKGTGRFQIWFTSTGTLWIDDVQLVEVQGELYRPGRVIRPAGGVNLIPNAGFECGTSGWGSTQLDQRIHWGGPVNRLFGSIDRSQAARGQASLKIDLSPQTQPVSYFDYFDLSRRPIQAPLCANAGYLALTPGKPYTFSVFVRAKPPDTPVRLVVHEFSGRRHESLVLAADSWQRHHLTFTPASAWCYVAAGPDLRLTGQTPHPPPAATVWLDAMQLEASGQPTPPGPRQPLEVGLATDKTGNVFTWNEPIEFTLSAAASGDAAPENARVDLRLTDFFDETVWQQGIDLSLRPGESRRKPIRPAAGPKLRGYLRLTARWTSAGQTSEQSIRLASIPDFAGSDSRFGVNHAYPWPHLLDLCRKAGLLWVRDWSCKWHQVEPQPGRFTFQETDAQIDRPLAHGLRVLGLAPFPSAYWSSSGAKDFRPGANYHENREQIARAPRNQAEFENYVGRTVAHYRGRIAWWQVFNEPLYTSYSLPRRFGYTGTDYARWTAAFAGAARRADPHVRILAGIGGLSEGDLLRDWKEFFAAGGLEHVDAVDIHHYPRIRPPEYIEKTLQSLNELMDRQGGRKPLWLTEYGYYADDDPVRVPMPNSGFDFPLPSETIQAAYAVRWNVIMLAGGVEKIFYHAGTCDGLHRDSLQGIFFEYAGTPHKIYAAQAVMSHLFTPRCKFAGRLDLGDSLRGYLFQDGPRHVAAVWAPQPGKTRPLEVGNPRIHGLDLMGRPLPGNRFTPGGTPVYLVAEGLSRAEFAAAVHRAK